MKNKLKQTILYIANKSKEDPAFGLTKLNKILFTADFYYFGFTGKPITGAQYIHLDWGPAPREMAIVLDELVSEGKAEIVENDFFGKKQKRLIPKIECDLSEFSEGEIKFIDHIIKTLSDWNGSDLSLWTHSLTPWLITSDKEEIPYYSIFALEDLPIEKDGMTWAKKELEAIMRHHEVA